MKKLVYILSLIGLVGCGTDSSLDCFQNSGEIAEKEYENLKGFKEIIVFERVQLIISQGETQKVVVKTGENLLNEIKVRVDDSILKVSNRNSCNLIRDYGITQVHVTSPNIVKIRNDSGLTIKSEGVLTYPRLDLISDSRASGEDFHVDGDFKLNLDVGTLIVSANGISRFYLTGKASNCVFGIHDSDVRIEAGDLEVQNLFVYHRGTNRMIVNPQVSIQGKIRSLGDVISKNRPPIVKVEEFFRGRLIFE